MKDEAAEAFAIHSAGSEGACQGCAHFVLAAIDLVVQCPVQLAHMRQLLLRVDTVGIDAGDERGRAQRTTDRARGNAQHILAPDC